MYANTLISPFNKVSIAPLSPSAIRFALACGGLDTALQTYDAGQAQALLATARLLGLTPDQVLAQLDAASCSQGGAHGAG